MAISNRPIWRIHKLFYLLTTVLLFSCGGSGGGGSNAGNGGGNAGGGNEAATTVTSLSTEISGVTESVAEGMTGAGGSSEDLADLMDLFGITLIDSGDAGTFDDLIALIEDLIDASSADLSEDGGVITIVPTASQFCDSRASLIGRSISSDDYDDCLAILDGIVVTLTTETSGLQILTFSHDGNVITRLEYSSDQVVFTVNIAELYASYNSMIGVISPSDVIPEPDSITGELMLTIEELGVDHGSIQFDVSEAIEVEDASEGVDLFLAVSTLFFAEADAVAGEATVSAQLDQISALFPVEVDDIGTEEAASFDLAAGTELTLNVTDGGAGMDGVITVGALNYDIDSQDQLDFFLDPGFTVNPTTGLTTLTTELILNLSYANSFGLFGYNGALDILAPANTSFVRVRGTNVLSSVYQVESGSVSFTGSDDFASYTATVNIGECFDIDGETSCDQPTSCEDVSGQWELNITNVDSPLCGPEDPWTETISIEQNVCTLLVSDFTDSLLSVFDGVVDGQEVTIGPFQKNDGGGITTATFTMTLSANGLSMSGSESWTWSDGLGGGCGDGTADANADKL